MPVRPRSRNLIRGGGRRRCACCGCMYARATCDDAVLPNEVEGERICDPKPAAGEAEGEVSVPEEEARPRKELQRPTAPSQAEIDKHRIDHLPYRNWCPECVEGFGRERAHHNHEGDGRSIPLVSCDCLWLTPRGVFSRDEVPDDEREEGRRVIIVKCAATRCMFAHAVPQKGVDPDGFVVDRLKDDIVWLGHANVVIRSDNEPALVRVVEKVAKLLKQSEGVTASCEGSVPYDPQTNGHAEGAVKLFKGMFRTLLLGLEKQVQGKIPLDHPSISLLISHAAHVRNLRIVGEDGRTPQQMAKGTSTVPALLGFGEVCRYHKRAQERAIAHSTSAWST